MNICGNATFAGYAPPALANGQCVPHSAEMLDACVRRTFPWALKTELQE